MLYTSGLFEFMEKSFLTALGSPTVSEGLGFPAVLNDGRDLTGEHLSHLMRLRSRTGKPVNGFHSVWFEESLE